jgi:imidazolonepropionase-like amidohydrolase
MTNPTKRPRCSAIARSGHPCQWPAGYRGLCLAHAAAHGVPEAIALQTSRGAKGRATSRVRRAERASVRVSLGTPIEIRRLLERAAELALAASGDHLSRARALATIAGQAAELLARGIEAQAARLAALLAENPKAAARMRSE